MLNSLIDKQKRTHGKLYSCFVNFKKAFPVRMACCGTAGQVLETVGIRRPMHDCIKSLYTRDSAAASNQEGIRCQMISDIFDCLALSGTGTGNCCCYSVSRYRRMLQLQHQEHLLTPYLSTFQH